MNYYRIKKLKELANPYVNKYMEKYLEQLLDFKYEHLYLDSYIDTSRETLNVVIKFYVGKKVWANAHTMTFEMIKYQRQWKRINIIKYMIEKMAKDFNKKLL